MLIILEEIIYFTKKRMKEKGECKEEWVSFE